MKTIRIITILNFNRIKASHFFCLSTLCSLLFSCLGADDKHPDIPYLAKSELRHLKWSEFCDYPETEGAYTLFRSIRLNDQNLYYNSIILTDGIKRYVFHNSRGEIIKAIDLPFQKEKLASLTDEININGEIMLDIDIGDKPDDLQFKGAVNLDNGAIRDLVFIGNLYANSCTDNPLIVNEDTLLLPEKIIELYRKVVFSPIQLKSPYATREDIEDFNVNRLMDDDTYNDSINAVHEEFDRIDRLNAPQIKIYEQEKRRRYVENLKNVIDKNKDDLYLYTINRYSFGTYHFLIVDKFGIAFRLPEEIDHTLFPDYAAKIPESAKIEVEGYQFEKFDSSTGITPGTGRGNFFNTEDISYYNLIHNTDTIKFKSDKYIELWDVIPKNKNNKTTFVLKRYDDFLFMEFDYNKAK